MDNVLVTIGLCVRNCEKTIGETLDSIISQNYPHNMVEIIVVDDGCHDSTIPVVMEKMSKTDINFEVIETGGRGLGMARQKVVDHANGKYIVWIDGDMVIPPDHISKQVEFMESHSRIGKARAKLGRFKSKTSNFLADSYFLAYIGEAGTQRKLTGIGGSICRVDAIKDAGGFDVHIKGAGEDIDLATRMLACGWDFLTSDAIFCHMPKTSWKELWNQYVWYGYGAHYVRHKHKIKNIGMSHLPPLALAISIRKAVVAFKFTGKKISFLLPLPFLFCSFAWWIGFAKAYFEKYFPKASTLTKIERPRAYIPD